MWEFIFRYLLRSGNLEHLSDKFYNTSVEILPVNKQLNHQNITSDGFVVVGRFDSQGLAEGNVDLSLGKVSAVRLKVHSESENWVILSEVSVALFRFETANFFMSIQL